MPTRGLRGLRVLPPGRSLPGEDEDARVRRIMSEARVYREYRRHRVAARGASQAELEAVRAELLAQPVDATEQIARLAGRLEREARKLLAAGRLAGIEETLRERGLVVD